MTGAPQPLAYHALSKRAVITTMAGIMITMLMAALDQTIVGTALPRIVSELHGFEHYSGVITAYMIAATTVLPIAGKLSDVYGRKHFILLGVIWFMGASALCGFASSMMTLVLFRGLQGVGAGIVQTMAFTTIADLFPPAKRGRIIGYMMSVYGLSSVVGPLIGGYLTDGPGWRYCFYVNIPVGLAALVVLAVFFPNIRPQKTVGFKIDFAGALTLICSIVPVLLALSWGGRDYAWSSPLIVGMLAAGLFLALVFLRVELKAPHPIMNLSLFDNSIVSIALAAAALTSVAMFGATLFIPLFVQSVLGATATESGKILMPLTFSLLVMAIVSGQGITRTGRYRPFAIGGIAVSTVGVYLLSLMNEGTTHAVLIRDIVITGFGLGAAMPVFNLAVQNAVEVRVVGSATSMVQFMRSIGGALGVALFGSVLSNRFTPAFHDALPSDLKARLTPEQFAGLGNAQSYMRPEGLKQLSTALKSFGLESENILNSIREAARTGLTVSLHDVFLIASGLLFFATGLTLFLREIPLRKSNRPTDEMPMEGMMVE